MLRLNNLPHNVPLTVTNIKIEDNTTAGKYLIIDSDSDGTVLTADRTLTIDVNNTSPTLDLLTGTNVFTGPLTLTQNSDSIALSHDGADAYVKWNDGSLVLRTDEGENTASTVKIQGKGTGHSQLFIYDQDDAEYLALGSFDGMGTLYTDGTSPGNLRFQHLGSPVTFFDSVTSGNPTITIHGWDSNASALDSYSINAGMDAGAGTRLTIGLDETMRTMVICDAGDIATDFGLTVNSAPSLYMMSSSGADYVRINYTGFHIFSPSGFSLVTHEDTVSGNAVEFRSIGSLGELTDTNGPQAWVLIELKANQTDTAALDALYINGTLTSLGDGSTGDGNNYFRIATGGSTLFRIDTTGGIHPAGLKSGTDQSDAGAAAGELYSDSNDDNTVKIGV